MLTSFDPADRESVEISRQLAEQAAKDSGLSESQASRAGRANSRIALGQERDRSTERSVLAELNRNHRRNQGGEA